MSQSAGPDPPPDGRIANLIAAVKGLTLSNLLVLAGLLLILAPAYFIYRSLNDPQLMDRLLSTYREVPMAGGCTVREAKTRGGPDQWGISTGLTYAGSDRWILTVILDHEPSPTEVQSYCETAKIISDAVAPP